MSDENSDRKGQQHTRDSMLKNEIDKWKEGAATGGNSKEVGAVMSTQADEDRNQVSELGGALQYPSMVDEQDISQQE